MRILLRITLSGVACLVLHFGAACAQGWRPVTAEELAMKS
jgi:hypothetical protein